ncbi:family 16 glycoside hydrolase [Arcticibacterium luteifluviistationis]|uniref:3-keto-alpha-glucoside-1,2-lyase/3-keto-2-hydroxy-glucal hydratase domain-containing protein n=1 Tax=Arcticibacterium luteifluviistationis TaxID=1784714 RepID=A0A2Z4G757_9BACT|nr:family 16 glycoside hydrolase [Arcticibacterium luteifluviistationis]AWV96918.1 hypothetical protein DJ013_01485 [Arcticibacterium luteifluviistationis]
MKLSLWKPLLLLLPFLSLHAQDFPATSMNKSDWEATGAQWRDALSISVHPFEDKMELTNGTGILFVNGKSVLKSKKKFSDYKIEFEVLQNKETKASFILGNGLKLNLDQSANQKNGKFGSIVTANNAVQKPKQEVCKLPGLWQKVELAYTSPVNGGLAVLEKVVLNDVIVFENYIVQNPTLEPTSIAFDVSDGLLAVKNVKYIELGYRTPISLSNLNYTLQETHGWQEEWAATETAPIKGKSKDLQIDIPHDFRWFSIDYTGDMDVAQTDKYAITIEYSGFGYLKIDGKKVLGADDMVNRQPLTALIELEKGKHSFEYFYRRTWQKPAFGLYVSGSDFKPYGLHPYKSLPAPQLPGGIFENPTGTRAQMIRSFMDFKGEKKTTTLSIGTAERKNYSIDLVDASMLYAWKGDFADVTEMWFNRGEPQLLKPLGQVVTLSGKPSFFLGKDDVVLFKEYFIDDRNLPTYLHTLNGSAVSQKIEPVKNGFEFTISAENKDVNYLLGTGEKVEKVGDTLYRIDDYYIQLAKKVALEIKTENGISSLSGKANAIESFKLIW